MRLPSINPPLPAATASTMSGVGRLAITVSARSATSRTEPAASAPSFDQPLDRLGPGVEHHDPVARLDQTAGHMEAHLAQSDEADVHVRSFPLLFLRSM